MNFDLNNNSNINCLKFITCNNNILTWYNKNESKVFLKIRRNGLAESRDPQGGSQWENCDILKI